MSKHLLPNIAWRELHWQRPYKLETVWEVLTHLAALTPRGAMIWEVRGSNSNVVYLLGADQMYISKIEDAFRAHGDVHFREVAGGTRQPVAIVRSLKISHPQLSLNNTTESVIRAGLAAMAADKSGAEMVFQVVLGRGFAPYPTPTEPPDPSASWLNVIFGSVSKATAEARKTIREKADQHGFQAAIRIGTSSKNDSTQLRSLISVLRVLESAGVRIRDEAERPITLTMRMFRGTFRSSDCP